MPLPDLRESPLVSVLIANYNYARYIGEAIESLQRQSYSNFEVVICDDGSSDDSCAVIQDYAAADSRITFHAKRNAGQASALNLAFSHCCGDIVCILDADDTFVATKIEAVVRTFLRSPQSGIVIHDLLIVDGDGRKKGESRFSQEGYLGPEIPTLRLGLPMPQASGLSFRREVLEQIFPLPEEEFRSCADWAIAYAAAYLTNTSRIPEILARYRIHGSNLSGSTSTAPDLQEEAIARILSGMNRVLSFTDRFVQTRFNTSVAATQVRNVLEHRLMLCLLRKDTVSLFSAAHDLKNAYYRARRDYPPSRYLFWQLLSHLPATVGQTVLVLAFRAFRFQRAIRET
jgi:glycosyltransferase involved in cell wall biosynthesis